MTEPGGWGRIAKRIRVPLGFAFAVVFLYLARPTALSLAWSLLPVLAGLSLRAYASGYVKKNAELTVTGPYAWTRNPLYLGSMGIAFGFAAAARSWPIAVLLAVLFAVIYYPVIRGEEEFLRTHFIGFSAYAKRVPRLLPWRAPLRSDAGERGSFAPALYRKHREYNASMGVAALYLALALRIAFKHGF
jgi:protein-S-isoprenylcysteine O-methyltransferase Ste14